MTRFSFAKLRFWLPQLNYQIWVLAAGRLLSQMGSGFTLFYAPIFFVNQVGLSAMAVGIGLGSSSISGVLGRVLGGSLADSPFGRRRTLLLSAVISAIASFVLAITSNFPVFVVGNLLMGLGLGLYWPPNEAMVADLTTSAQRNEAFAITRLCDSLGLGLGVVMGGLLIQATGAYRSLFVIDGLSFLVLLAVVFWVIQETYQPDETSPKGLRGWGKALRDRRLLTFSVVNIMFTTYLVQLSSTLPLYFTNFVSVYPSGQGFDAVTISALFAWHLAVSVLFQLPFVRLLNRVQRTTGLIVSAICFGIGFVTLWATGVATQAHLGWAVVALSIFALATIAYMPSASSVVVDLAPKSLRGVYLGVNSQCWAIGYLIGPPLGGWALDQSRTVAHTYWLGLAASIVVAIAVLLRLQQMMQQSDRQQESIG